MDKPLQILRRSSSAASRFARRKPFSSHRVGSRRGPKFVAP